MQYYLCLLVTVYSKKKEAQFSERGGIILIGNYVLTIILYTIKKLSNIRIFFVSLCVFIRLLVIRGSVNK